MKKEVHDFLQECKGVYADIHQTVEHIQKLLKTPQGQFLVNAAGLSTVILFGDNEDIYQGEKKGGLAYVYGSQRNINALLDLIIKQRDAEELPSVKMSPPKIRLDGDRIIIEENKDESDI